MKCEVSSTPYIIPFWCGTSGKPAGALGEWSPPIHVLKQNCKLMKGS